MRRLGRVLKNIVVFAACLLGGTAIGLLIYRGQVRLDISERRTISSPNGIELLEPVTIGGTEQWLLIRGQDRNAPILLYVHGGPGAPMLPLAHAFQDPLEENFVVVQWDQRGSGKSRASGTTLTGATIETMIEDTLEVSQHICRRFERDKIVLLGHSWGSVLGVNAIRREPDLYAAYIGVGQVVDMQDNETRTYQFTLDEARARGESDAIARLEALAPYPDPDPQAMVRKMGTQRLYLNRYGGSLRIPGGLGALMWRLLTSPEYSLGDSGYYLLGSMESLNAFAEPLMLFDARALGTRFDVPIFIISGTYDYQVPFEIASAWWETLEAPHKEFHWLHDSAHMPMLSEPETFGGLLKLRVLPVVRNEAPAKGVNRTP